VTQVTQSPVQLTRVTLLLGSSGGLHHSHNRTGPTPYRHRWARTRMPSGDMPFEVRPYLYVLRLGA